VNHIGSTHADRLSWHPASLTTIVIHSGRCETTILIHYRQPCIAFSHFHFKHSLVVLLVLCIATARSTNFFLRLRNDLYCVWWGVKLYSLSTNFFSCFPRFSQRFFLVFFTVLYTILLLSIFDVQFYFNLLPTTCISYDLSNIASKNDAKNCSSIAENSCSYADKTLYT